MDDILTKRSSIENWKVMGERVPEIMEAWRGFHRAVMKDGHLDRKTKELIMVAIMHVTGCHWCIDVHVRNARKLGATPEEIAETVGTAALIVSGSTMMHHIGAVEAQDYYEEMEQKS
jgi:AhpD family alkylhydroperoxidase